ncbi:MAG: hypothetical protein FWH22_01055 [Fibromonadales bacterium]|nr:hypothetical protein [Fibromonadales bacterium]
MLATSAVTGYSNAVYQGNSPKVNNFNNILQEQISKAGSEAEIPENIARWSGLKNGVPNQFDWAEVEARGHVFDNFRNDPELHAYVLQLALENGIKPGGSLDNPDYMGRGRQTEFSYQVSELLDKGLISRQDVINAVKFPPQVHINGEGFSMAPNMNGFGKSNESIELTYAIDLFKLLWGKEKASSLILTD